MTVNLIYTLYLQDKVLVQLIKFVKKINVTGAETFTFDTEKMVLSAGDSIVAVSQAPLNLSATVSFLEV